MATHGSLIPKPGGAKGEQSKKDGQYVTAKRHFSAAIIAKLLIAEMHVAYDIGPVLIRGIRREETKGHYIEEAVLEPEQSELEGASTESKINATIECS